MDAQIDQPYCDVVVPTRSIGNGGPDGHAVECQSTYLGLRHKYPVALKSVAAIHSALPPLQLRGAIAIFNTGRDRHLLRSRAAAVANAFHSPYRA